MFLKIETVFLVLPLMMSRHFTNERKIGQIFSFVVIHHVFLPLSIQPSSSHQPLKKSVIDYKSDCHNQSPDVPGTHSYGVVTFESHEKFNFK